ncbi:MAG: tetratricopeptide repeat protein [Alphaproteobacteria bacterium]
MALCLLVSITACQPRDDTKDTAPEPTPVTEKPAPPLPDTLAGSFLISQFAQRNEDPQKAYTHAQIVLDKGGYDPSVLRYARLSALSAGNIQGALRDNTRLRAEDRDISFYVLSFFQAYQNKNWDQAASFLPPLAANASYQSLEPLFRAWLGVARAADTAPQTQPMSNDVKDAFADGAAGDMAVLSKIQQGYALALLGQPDAGLGSLRAAFADLKAMPVSVIITTAALMHQQNQSIEAGFFLRSGMDADMTQTALNMAKNGDLPLMTNPLQGIFYLFQDLASVFNRPGTEDHALMYATLAHAMMPENPFVTLSLGQILADIGAERQANAVYQRVPATNPLFWVATLYRTHLTIKQDNTKDALTLMAPLYDRYPDNITIKSLYADLLKSSLRFSDALPLYDALIQASQAAPQGRFYASRGMCYERLKQWDAGEKDLLKALDLQPQDPLILNYLAYSWIDRGVNLDRAVALLEKALSLAPNNPEILDSLAWGYHKKGNNDRALEGLQKAVALSPDEPVILSHYGDVLWAMGKHRLAGFAWDSALDIVRSHKKTNPQKTLDITEEELVEKLRQNP